MSSEMNYVIILLSLNSIHLNLGLCTGHFCETDLSNAGNGVQRPQAGTPCVGPCKLESGRWGSSWCYTDEEEFQWGAECVSCSKGLGEECPDNDGKT